MAHIPAKIKCDCCYTEVESLKNIPEGWRRVSIMVRASGRAHGEIISEKDLCTNCEYEKEVRVNDPRLPKKREIY